MDILYEKLNDGDDPATALRKTKLAVLKSSNHTVYSKPLGSVSAVHRVVSHCLDSSGRSALAMKRRFKETSDSNLLLLGGEVYLAISP